MSATRRRIPRPVLVAGAAAAYLLLRMLARVSPGVAIALFWVAIAVLTVIMILAIRRAPAEAASGDTPSKWGPLIFLFGFGLPLGLILTIGALRDDR